MDPNVTDLLDLADANYKQLLARITRLENQYVQLSAVTDELQTEIIDLKLEMEDHGHA